MTIKDSMIFLCALFASISYAGEFDVNTDYFFEDRYDNYSKIDIEDMVASKTKQIWPGITADTVASETKQIWPGIVKLNQNIEVRFPEFSVNDKLIIFSMSLIDMGISLEDLEMLNPELKID